MSSDRMQEQENPVSKVLALPHGRKSLSNVKPRGALTGVDPNSFHL